MEYAVRITEEE